MFNKKNIGDKGMNKKDKLTLQIFKPFLPKRVLKMTRENQFKHINKNSQKFCDA